MKVLVACEESQRVCCAFREKPEKGWENQQFTKDGRYGGFGGTWGVHDGKWRRYGDPEVAKERSKTFPGIAQAMADQWG